jgi:hypothetical protein
MGAKVRVSQRLKSLRGIVVQNCGFSETDFFVVCDDIWIAICPFFVVVTPKIPPLMFMQLLKFNLFFHYGRGKSLLICPFSGLKEENLQKWM